MQWKYGNSCVGVSVSSCAVVWVSSYGGTELKITIQVGICKPGINLPGEKLCNMRLH